MLNALVLILALQAPVAQPFARHPDIFGDKVVFTSEGDLWIGDLQSKSAQRLTRSAGTEYTARFSPDGTQIAYAAEYAGMREIYVIPVEGGVPRRVTYLNQYPEVVDWTPDGKAIILRKNGVPSWRACDIVSVPVEGGAMTRLPLEFASHIAPNPKGQGFAFTRFFRITEPWFRYAGGLRNDIWVFDGKERFTRVFTSKYTNEYPVWAGDRLVWVNDEGGRFSLLSAKPDGSSLKKLVGPSELMIRNLQTDGKRLVYERGISLEMADLATGATTPLLFQMPSDKQYMLPYRASPETNFVGASIGPTGKRVLVETRGQIVSVPAGEGDVRVVLATPGVRYQSAAFSPDGKKIAFIGDATREQQLYVADADGSNARQLTTDTDRQLKRLAWSPDGKRIALTDSLTRLRLVDVETGKDVEVAKGTGWDGPTFDITRDGKWIAYESWDRVTDTPALFLYEVATAKAFRLGDGKLSDWNPAFSMDGKWLAFFTRRAVSPTWDGILNQLNSGNPIQVCLVSLQKGTKSPLLPGNDEEAASADSPAKVGVLEPDGIYSRAILLPIPAGSGNGIAWTADRLVLQSDATLSYYDPQTKRSGVLATDVGGWQVSYDGKKLLLVNGSDLRVVDATAEGAGPAVGRLSFAGLTLQIDPVKEWEGIYWDGWRIIRDYFYVQNMHGNDWKAVGAKYAQFLPSVRSRDELNILFYWMLSELSVSHAGVSGGDTQGLWRPARPSFLGVDLEPDPSGFYRIKTIFRGDDYRVAERSPLAEQGLDVAEGMFLIEVGGVPARVGSNFQEALVGRAGQVVAVKVSDKPSAAGARTIRVRPIADENRLRYLQWVKGRRDYVDKATGGRIGYVHLAAMSTNDVGDFILQYFAQRNRDAIIVDDRFNGGGNVSNSVIAVLKQKRVLNFNNRNNAQPWSRQGDAFDGPLACLMNEYSGSNGEEFPHHFRAMKLGPVIGRRTWGGEVGAAPGWKLADGGVISVPNYGAWSPEKGWEIEGPGLAPDIDVESDPNLWIKGVDPQLDKAIQMLMDELKRNPRKPAIQPPDPDKVGAKR